jgi:hypothetical protein
MSAMAKSGIVAFRLADVTAKQHLERIASNNERVKFTHHARLQMRQRGIGPELVLNCLRKGTITESPVLDMRGNWQLRIERYASGENIGCAVAIDIGDPRAIIITAFWVQ